MIKLDVRDYCHACMDFSPDVIPPVRELVPPTGEIKQSDTIIQCEHRRRCDAIRKYLERQMKTEEVAG